MCVRNTGNANQILHRNLSIGIIVGFFRLIKIKSATDHTQNVSYVRVDLKCTPSKLSKYVFQRYCKSLISNKAVFQIALSSLYRCTCLFMHDIISLQISRVRT